LSAFFDLFGTIFKTLPHYVLRPVDFIITDHAMFIIYTWSWDWMHLLDLEGEVVMVEVVGFYSVCGHLWRGLTYVSDPWRDQWVNFATFDHLCHCHVHEAICLIILLLRSSSSFSDPERIAGIVWRRWIIIDYSSVGSLLYDEFIILYWDLVRLQMRLRSHQMIVKWFIHCIRFWVHLNENVLCDRLIVIMLNWWPLVL